MSPLMMIIISLAIGALFILAPYVAIAISVVGGVTIYLTKPQPQRISARMSRASNQAQNFG